MTMVVPSEGAMERQIIPGLTVRSLVLFLLATPVQFVVGFKFHSKAAMTIRHCGRVAIGMDFMISLGTSAAYVYSLVNMVAFRL